MIKVAVGLMCLMLMGSTVICYADGVVIGKSIKISEFKKEVSKHGLNLSGTDYADGFVESKGNEIKVITYKPVTLEQLEIIKQAAFKAVRK